MKKKQSLLECNANFPCNIWFLSFTVIKIQKKSTKHYRSYSSHIDFTAHCILHQIWLDLSHDITGNRWAVHIICILLILRGGGGISTDRGFDSWRIIWDTSNNTSCTLYSADQLILTSPTARSSIEVARHRSSWNISHCLLFILNEELALSVTWCTPNPNSKYSYGK
mgnify:CR=1 FL=1